MKKILLYGFSGFDKFTHNPSKDLVNDLYRKCWPEITVQKCIFKVSYNEVRRKIPNIVRGESYDLILGFGLSAATTHIRLEKKAANWHDSETADIEGEVINDQVIMSGERSVYQARMNLTRIKEALIRASIPTAISMYAGGYVCNFSYYLFLHHIKTRKQPTKCLFVHMPFSSEIICRKKFDYPSFPKDMLTRAGEIIMASALGLKWQDGNRNL